MNTRHHIKSHGFSMIEMVIVVTIIGIMATIAIPKFADAGSGRRLSSAKRTLIGDIESAQLRARATSKVHVVKFYPSENRYIIFEGEDVRREAAILVRDFDEEPYTLGLNRTNLGGDEYAVISVYGDITPGFSVGLLDDGIEIAVVIGGVADFGVTPTLTITDGEATGIDTFAAVEIK